jgi:rhomboid family GlyGly-CTERM serine protease
VSAEASSKQGGGLCGSAVQPLTGLLGLLAGAVFVLPGATELLAWDRAAIGAGEWWRVISGHWVHWSGGHLAWDVGAFVLLGLWCEQRGRGRFVTCVTAAALAIPIGLWWLCPELSRYGGLSGIDSALFVLLVCELFAEALRERSGFSLAVSGVLLLGFAGKIAFEVASGEALFAADLGAGVVPVPWAHLVGAAVGLACLLFQLFVATFGSLRLLTVRLSDDEGEVAAQYAVADGPSTAPLD